MESKAIILSIKQNLICQQKTKKRSGVVFISSFIIVIFLLCMSIESVSFGEFAHSVCYIYNPVNSLYGDNSAIVFANTNLPANNTDFTIPIVSNKYEVLVNGDVVFEVVNSIMVKSIEDGIVEECGISNDGIKYIKIRHTIDVYSIIENVDIIGVNVYDKVKQGQEIATAKLGQNIKLQIFVKDEKLQNLQIHQSKIIWK